MDVSKSNSLVELYFSKYKEINNSETFLQWLKPENTKEYSWQDVTEKIFKLSHKIRKVITSEDRCLLISENRPEWLIADLAIMNAGGISVPIFTTYSDNDYKYIIEDCKPSVIIVSNQVQFNKIKKYINNEIKLVISFEEINHQSLIIRDIFNDEKFEKIENKNLARKSKACIIYTSGTSGNPKGVVLSHGGILSNCQGALEVLKSLIEKERIVFLTWLPLSHSYEHTVQFVQILLGAKVFMLRV